MFTYGDTDNIYECYGPFLVSWDGSDILLNRSRTGRLGIGFLFFLKQGFFSRPQGPVQLGLTQPSAHWVSRLKYPVKPNHWPQFSVKFKITLPNSSSWQCVLSKHWNGLWNFVCWMSGACRVTRAEIWGSVGQKNTFYWRHFFRCVLCLEVTRNRTTWIQDHLIK